MSHTCINCGQQNWLGDCCPECAARTCDRCDITIPMDEENTPSCVFGYISGAPRYGLDEFPDGAYNVCDECLTVKEIEQQILLNQKEQS